MYTLLGRNDSGRRNKYVASDIKETQLSTHYVNSPFLATERELQHKIMKGAAQTKPKTVDSNKGGWANKIYLLGENKMND